ncbi:hypothetical protein K402DRAFT_437789 [Aulographum hederae CBS 113979]|uniref:Uncharacterized protein n=1 Tax=Aulographum hederae CBS 113979 TaxID=1176131 RepID=A0A6G1GNV8_9PEZI|nr:hypothetical protein K402DRAFT_437789 [Aulographum hederae CBS 113979]
MDPFSITVGAVALTETALKLSRALINRYQAYDAAPKEMVEIADQVTFCSGLVDVFAKSVDGTGRKFPKNFTDHATNLVKKVRNYKARLRYAFGDQKKILKLQTRLRQVEHMFMFMTTCYNYHLQSADIHSQSTAAIPPGSLKGVLQQIPVQLSVNGPDRASYEATITLKPVQRPEPQHFAKMKESKMKESRSRGAASQVQALENMRRSLLFSSSLLQRTSSPQVNHNYYDSQPESSEFMGRERLSEAEWKSKEEAPSTRLVTEDEARVGVRDLLSQV